MNSRYKYYLLIIVVTGIAVRLYFYTGHIFSDDAYYSYLSYTLLNGNFANEYLGYPLFLLRIGHVGLTSLAFLLFGINEFASIFFPLLISIVNLFLTYRIAFIFTENKNVALVSVLFMAFFPTDVIFATINFADTINVFIINLGLYYLYKTYKSGANSYAIIGSVVLSLSIFFKENLFYTVILITAIFLYLIIKRKEFNFLIAISICIIIISFAIEGFFYLLVHNDFLYRFNIMNKNYLFCYYDFFPYTAQQFSGIKNYWRNLFDQLILINIKSVFLRRFYLFLPIAAMVQIYLNIKNNKNLLLAHWFFGTAVLLIFMTTSFTEYKPMDLQRSWYIFPLLMPMTILVALMLINLKQYISSVLVVIYITGSLIMCTHYEVYFNKKDKADLKSYINEHKHKYIFTDHYTKYGVDLIRNYEAKSKTMRISENYFEWALVNKGDWILINPKHIEELKMQKFTFPDFSILKSKSFREIKSFGDFRFYEKLN